jgi:hypothetical protein
LFVAHLSLPAADTRSMDKNQTAVHTDELSESIKTLHSTWEDVDYICQLFSHFSLRDEAASKDEGMSQTELKLVAVDIFKTRVKWIMEES